MFLLQYYFPNNLYSQKLIQCCNWFIFVAVIFVIFFFPTIILISFHFYSFVRRRRILYCFQYSCVYCYCCHYHVWHCWRYINGFPGLGIFSTNHSLDYNIFIYTLFQSQYTTTIINLTTECEYKRSLICLKYIIMICNNSTYSFFIITTMNGNYYIVLMCVIAGKTMTIWDWI